MEKIIYLDHAATTPARPEVVEAMMPYFTEKFWNPSSVYSPAAEAKKAVNEVRDRIADLWAHQARIFILRPAALRRTTGPSRRLPKPMPQRENISLQARSSTMRFFTPASIWRETVMR